MKVNNWFMQGLGFIEADNSKGLHELVSQGSPITEGREGLTLLHHAVLAGKKNAVKGLLKTNILFWGTQREEQVKLLRAINPSKQGALHIALSAIEVDKELVKLILDRAKELLSDAELKNFLNLEDSTGRTALDWAENQQKADQTLTSLVETLKKAGAKNGKRAQPVQQPTIALHPASPQDTPFVIVGEEKFTEVALVELITEDNGKRLAELVAKGLNVASDQIRIGEETLLKIAVRQGKIEATKGLLTIPSDTTYKQAQKALLLTENLLHIALQARPMKFEMIEMLVKKAQEIFKDDNKGLSEFLNAKDTDGKTALDLAVSKGSTEIVKFLLKSGANIELIQSPLHQALQSGPVDITMVQALLDHAQAKYKDDKLVKFLDIRDAQGKTALNLAMKGNHQEVAKLLVQAGASIDIVTKKDRTGNELDPKVIALFTEEEILALAPIVNAQTKRIINKEQEEREAEAKKQLEAKKQKDKELKEAELSKREKANIVDRKTKAEYDTPPTPADLKQEIHQQVEEYAAKWVRAANDSESLKWCNSTRLNLLTLLRAHRTGLKNDAKAEKNFCLGAALMLGVPIQELELFLAGADINETNLQGMNALHWAIFNDNAVIEGKKLLYPFEEVKSKHGVNNKIRPIDKLLDQRGIKINAKTQTGDTLLHLAIKYGNATLVTKLLEQEGIELDVQNSSGQTPIFLIMTLLTAAAEQLTHLQSLLVVAKQELEELKHNKKDTTTAASKIEVLKAQIEEEEKSRKAEIAKYKEMFVPLRKEDAGVGQNQAPSGIRQRVQKSFAVGLGRMSGQNIGINEPDKAGNTLLHLAVRSGQVEILKLLLAVNGINSNIRNRENKTALHLAILNNNVEMVSSLLKAGCNPVIPDGAGNTPLHLAIEQGNIPIVNLLLARQEVQDHINDINKSEQTVLFMVQRQKGTRVWQTFLDKNLMTDLHDAGLDPDVINDEGQTAAEAAIGKGNTNLAKELGSTNWVQKNHTLKGYVKEWGVHAVTALTSAGIANFGVQVVGTNWIGAQLLHAQIVGGIISALPGIMFVFVLRESSNLSKVLHGKGKDVRGVDIADLIGQSTIGVLYYGVSSAAGASLGVHLAGLIGCSSLVLSIVTPLAITIITAPAMTAAQDWARGFGSFEPIGTLITNDRLGM